MSWLGELVAPRAPGDDAAAGGGQDEHMPPAGLYTASERPAGLADLEYEMYLYQQEEELVLRETRLGAGQARQLPAGWVCAGVADLAPAVT